MTKKYIYILIFQVFTKNIYTSHRFIITFFNTYLNCTHFNNIYVYVLTSTYTISYAKYRRCNNSIKIEKVKRILSFLLLLYFIHISLFTMAYEYANRDVNRDLFILFRSFIIKYFMH